MATVEQAWWTANPDPQVTQTADRLVLWNYPVGRTELAETHATAIRAFLGPLFLAPELTGKAISICGHASASGEAGANVALASARANNVGKLLADLGFKGFEVTSAGSSQPADTAPTGQAMARNRRVELTKTAITDIRPGPVPVPVSQPPKAPDKPPDKPAATPTGAALTFEYEFEIKLPTLDTQWTETKFTAIVKGKGKVIKGNGAVAAGISAKKGALAAKFEAKLGEHLKGKVGIDPGGKGKPPTAKVSLAGEVWGFPVEEGFQTSVNFIFMKVTLGTMKLPELDLGDAVVQLEFTLELKIELGPSKAALARLGISLGTTGAVAVGVVAVAGVIIGGTIYATEAGKARMARMVVDLGERDGAASRIAFECLGATQRVSLAMQEHRVDLTKAGGEPSRSGFESGSGVAGKYLDSLKDRRADRIKALKESYAKDANELDFDIVRKRVLEKLDPYQNEPKPLTPLLQAL